MSKKLYTISSIKIPLFGKEGRGEILLNDNKNIYFLKIPLQTAK
jgi:hypothetical protein